MKKGLILICLLLGLFFTLSIFLKPNSTKTFISLKDTSIKDEYHAMFFSYLEFESLLKGKDEVEMKNTLTTILDKLEEYDYNLLLVQVRSFSDAIYPSEIFPSSMKVVEQEGDELPFDILDYIVSEAHSRNMEVHAWVNPYRIRNTTDGSTISVKNPCYKWLGSNHVKQIEGKGIFYNPASEEVRTLILQGIEELLNNYAIDGVLFDDYFYPDEAIDELNYQVYLNKGGTLSLSEYHLEQVNELVRSTYTLVKKYNKKFGISPEGNIDNNYQQNHADTLRWITEEGYIDYIMPQIYFGFYNERKPFYETVRDWNQRITLDTIELIPALAFYKVGQEDTYALSGKGEWLTNTDIIRRQIIASRAVSHYAGFALFRYEYIFGEQYETETVLKEREALDDLLHAS